jgi:hypothetical protein
MYDTDHYDGPATVLICQAPGCQVDYTEDRSDAGDTETYCSRACETGQDGPEADASDAAMVAALGARPVESEAQGGPLTARAPEPGSRGGWDFSVWKRIGRAEAPATCGPDEFLVSAVVYGVYGVRTDGPETELFTQFEGYRLEDGSILGRSLLASSIDSDPYVWSPAARFSAIKIFQEA